MASPESCSQDSIDSEALNGILLAQRTSSYQEHTPLDEPKLINESINHQSISKSQSKIIPEQVKELDEIISPYADSIPPVVVAVENQSEDDGYMSLGRKNMNQNEHKGQIEDRSTDSKNGEKICDVVTAFNESKKWTINNKTLADHSIIQSTLPKARSAAINISSYSSLPCNAIRSANNESIAKYGSCAVEKSVLGIDISAVHNAVLRGELSKQLPEPIVNEHPITIYPGRLSPTLENPRGNRSHRIISSVKKHKEVCLILNPGSMVSSLSSSLSSSSSTNSADFPLISSNIGIKKTSKQKERNPISNENDIGELKQYFTNNKGSWVSTEYPSQSFNSIYPKKSNGVAWEIHFKGEKRKNKASSSRNKANRDSSYDSFSQNCDKFEKNYCESDSQDDCASNKFSDDLEYGNTIDTNMCGKGTFVIRRSIRKVSPNAADKKHLWKHNYQQYSINQLHNLNHEQNHSKPYHNSASYDRNFQTNDEKIDLKFSPICSSQKSLKKSKVKTRANDSQRMLNNENLLNKAKERTEEKNRVHNSTVFAYNDVPLRRELNHKTNQITLSMEISDKQYKKAIYDDRTDETHSYVEQKIKAPQEYADLRSSNASTDLPTTLEEDEEQLSDISYGNGPLKQIENNISALLRGDICIAQFGQNVSSTNDLPSRSILNPKTTRNKGVAGVISGSTSTAEKAFQAKRILEFRLCVHKSESSKEMLLSQNTFGPLPPSPPSSNPDLIDYDNMPPLPPSPDEVSRSIDDRPKPYIKTTAAEVHADISGDKGCACSVEKSFVSRHFSDELHQHLQLSFANVPPVPPHRNSNINKIKSRSIDSNYKRKSTKMLGYMGSSSTTTPTSIQATSCEGTYTHRRAVNYGAKRSLKQSPREEPRLQTSWSLPETPIFGRGCDIPRIPYRLQNENNVSGSRTAPRSSNSSNINMSNSIVGIVAGSEYGSSICQRSINHALVSNELLRMSGAPARGWYPKQRSMRPMSTENIDCATSVRIWDGNSSATSIGNARKPLTLPPNLTPSFLNKSPREALRRVASLLITKKKNSKDHNHKNGTEDTLLDISRYEYTENTTFKKEETKCSKSNAAPMSQKKKGIFKNFWKKTKHFSIDQ